MSWRSGYGVVYRYECPICEEVWFTKARTSRCTGCNIVRLPQTDLSKPSRIARDKDDEPEQLHLGAIDGSNRTKAPR